MRSFCLCTTCGLYMGKPASLMDQQSPPHQGNVHLHTPHAGLTMFLSVEAPFSGSERAVPKAEACCTMACTSWPTPLASPCAQVSPGDVLSTFLQLQGLLPSLKESSSQYGGLSPGLPSLRGCGMPAVHYKRECRHTVMAGYRGF